MALPYNEITSSAIQNTYLEPDETDDALLESFESGGVAISDASQGRLVQTWRAWVDGGGTSIKVSPISGDPVTELVTGGANITSVSLAWDSNMVPTICYCENAVFKLRWFNTVTNSIQTDSFEGVNSGLVATDDKRESQEGASDVIFGYTLDGVLYYRQQRDRYLVAYAVGLCLDRKLVRMGMNTKLRFQFHLKYVRT